METEHKCKTCDGLGFNDMVIHGEVAELIRGRLLTDTVVEAPDLVNNYEDAIRIEEELWLATEEEVIDKFRNMDIVEDDGVWCHICKGTGLVDWILHARGF